MFSRSVLVSLLGVVAIGSGIFATACSSKDSEPTAGDDPEIRAGGGVGATCSQAKKCRTGLLCKEGASSSSSGGPPPGAVGLPIESNSGSGPPPGAVGMPLPPSTGHCAEPEPGEHGGSCDAFTECHEGLECEYPDNGSGPPPGAVGMPISSSSSGSGGPPPGAVGLPIVVEGKCQPKSSGPPPGAVGLPVLPEK